MVEDGVHVGRKDRLRIVIDGNRRIGPPQKRLRSWRPIVQLYVDLQVGLAWVERETSRHFRPIHAVDFADPDRFAVITVRPDAILDRSERIRTMMLWPVELDPTRNPGTRKANQCWFDHAVIIDKIVAVSFI